MSWRFVSRKQLYARPTVERLVDVAGDLAPERKKVQRALRLSLALLVTSLLAYNVGDPGPTVKKVAAVMFWASFLILGATIIARVWGPWKDPE